MGGELINNQEKYAQMREALKALYVEVHAIYEPEGTESDPYFGDCYCCAVDLFRPGLTFRIWIKIVDGKIEFRSGDRWYFG